VISVNSSAMRRAAVRLRGPNNEGVLAVSILLLALCIGIVTPSFWNVSTLLNIGTNSLVTLVFAMGVLIVMISGGIDVSFLAIGIFAGYFVITVTNATGFGASEAWVGFALAAAVGLGLGLVNALAVVGLRLPTLIATLGTQGIFRGVLLAFIGAKMITTYPPGLDALGTNYLLTWHAGRMDTRLSVLIVPAILVCVVVALFLRGTLAGRGVYAIGDDAESARRAGFPVNRIGFMIYLIAGTLAGIAGMMHVTLTRMAVPQELVGDELDVIAAVVLGGASIFGGRGSVTGTVLGVILIAMIKSSLILLGVPGSWQRAAVGALLIFSVAAQAISEMSRLRGAGRRAVVAE
jgi:simple sugar transport system permease protein